MEGRPRGVSDGWPSNPWNPPSHLVKTVSRMVSFQPRVKLTVDNQDLLGSLLLGQSIENRIYCFTKDDTVCGDLLRRAKVLISEGARFDAVQYIASNVGLPAALLKIFQGRFYGNDVMGVVATLYVRKSLRENPCCK